MYRSPFTPMTDEERMLAAIRKSRNPFSAPTTMGTQVAAATRTLDPSKMPEIRATTLEEKMMMPPERDFSGEEATLANQRAYANSLRGDELPEGVRVGPSNIYVRNIWDSAETGFNRALGGYLSGKADKASGELSEEKKREGLTRARAEAKAKAAAERQRRREVDRADTMDVRDLEQTMRTRQTEEDRLEEQRAARLAADARQAEQAAQDNKESERDREYLG